MRRGLIIVAALGVVTTILISWALAAFQTVPMYAGTPAAILPRPYAGVFVLWERPWSAHEIRGFGFADRWWSDLRLSGYPGDEQKDAAVLVAEWGEKRDQYAQGPRFAHVRNAYEPPAWGTFRESAPPAAEDVIGSDTAFGWPLPCLWYQVRGQVINNATANSELYGGLHLRGTIDSRGRDFHALPLRPIWLWFLADVVFFSAAWWLVPTLCVATRRRIRQNRGKCVRCGYDLRGMTSHSDTCPECGTRRLCKSVRD